MLRPLRTPAARTSGAALIASLALLAACRPSRLQVIPVPPEVRSIEGYGTVKISRGGESGRSRFAFSLEAGKRGKVEVLDPLNRAAAEIFLAPGEAYVVLRRDKVFWKAAPEEVIERFLGVRLGLDDVAGLLCGRPPAPALTFNAPVSEAAFSLDFLAGFSSRTWEEIEKILRRED